MTRPTPTLAVSSSPDVFSLSQRHRAVHAMNMCSVPSHALGTTRAATCALSGSYEPRPLAAAQCIASLSDAALLDESLFTVPTESGTLLPGSYWVARVC
jgi:hypothetical protein